MALSVEQLEARKAGVGGSEVLAALGKDARCTRLELYLRKLGELPDPDLSDDPRVHFGTVIEPVLRREFASRIGTRVIQRHVTFRHPYAPLLGHPDGWIPAKREGLEIKCVDKFEADDFGEPGTDQVPLRFIVQCASYMALTNANRWHLAALIGGNDFRCYVIERDLRLESAILEGVRNFWLHVERHTPPDPATPEDVKLRWPKDLGSSVFADDEIAIACSELKAVRSEFSDAEARKEAIESRIKQYMQEAAQLVDADGTLLATWKSAKASQKFDAARFEAEHPELYQQYLREVPGSRRFLIK